MGTWLFLFFAFILTAMGILIVLMALWDLCLRIPFVPTPLLVSQAMCTITPWTGKERRIVDLGAGDGRLLECIRRTHPSIHADGFEISPVVWMLGVLRARWMKSGVHMHFQSLFEADLRDADVVYLYLLPSLMNRLASKLDCELKPGTPVISHAFRFKDRTPEKTLVVRVKNKDVTVLLYRW